MFSIFTCANSGLNISLSLSFDSGRNSQILAIVAKIFLTITLCCDAGLGPNAALMFAPENFLVPPFSLYIICLYFFVKKKNK